MMKNNRNKEDDCRDDIIIENGFANVVFFRNISESKTIISTDQREVGLELNVSDDFPEIRN